MPQTQTKAPDFIPAAPPDFIPADPPPDSAQLPPDTADRAFKAAVHGNMLGMDPGTAYKNGDEIDKQLRSVGGDYDSGELAPTIANDLKEGWEGSILGLTRRKALPEKVRDPGMFDKFLSGLTQTLADIPAYLAGGLIGGAAGSEIPVVGNAIGAGAGAFALPTAAREALVQGIKHGNVSSFRDILHRMAHVTWAGTKGAVVGAATEMAGGIPVGSFIGKSAIASMGVKGLYQATALTTTADLLDGRLPSKEDFAGNAALIVPLNIITHGVAMRHADVNEALLDVYAKDGKTPAESVGTLTAQPPVKPDLPEGLRPAINMGEATIDGDTTENHAELATRTLRTKPVAMEELEAEPAKADKVLENPVIHEQSVIDRAWEIKKEAIDSGNVPRGTEDEEKPLTIDDLYNRESMKSGRGFVTPDGKFLSRMEAKQWMKTNEPDVHEMWTSEVEGDKQAELHSEDYAAARNRTQARSLAEGDPVISNVSPQNASRLAAARAGLNKIKAGDASKGYGREVLRTLFVGQRDARIAATTQVRDALTELIPDFHDQEALSILRDYKGDPGKLAAEAERITTDGTDREKALLPSIEHALNPSPELLEADKRLTGYYAAALNEGRELGFMESTIEPSHYSPHILTRILDGEKPGVSRPAMSQSTPFGKERSYPTILDAMKTDRLDARTVNALDALSVYGDRHATVVATKLLARELSNTELGKYGTQDKHPEGWVEMAPGQAAFRNTRAITDADTGEAHILSQALYVPKDVAAAMRPIIESDVLSHQPGMKGLKSVQAFTKSIELGLSIFHMKALTVTAMNNMSFADFTRSLASDTKSPEFEEAERGWAADGLQTTKTSTPYEAYQGLKESSIKESFDVRELPGIKQLDAIAKFLTHETFDVIQRKFKVQDAELKSASWQGKHPDATDEEYFGARRSIAKEVNSAYGGLNWEVMGFGKNFVEGTRLVMLAPDWTFSNVMNLKYAGEGGPGGAAARMFWVKSFATGIALTQAASIAVGGKLSEHPTEVYLGKDKDGKKLYSNWFFAGAPKDAITLLSRVHKDGAIQGMAEFLVAKLGPIASTVVGAAANKDGTGRPISKPKDSALVKTGKGLEFMAGKAVPITVRTVVELLLDKNPDGTPKHHSMMEYVGALAGTYTVHEGAKGGTAKEEGVKLPGQSKTHGIKLPGQSKKFSIRK